MKRGTYTTRTYWASIKQLHIRPERKARTVTIEGKAAKPGGDTPEQTETQPEQLGARAVYKGKVDKS